MTKTHSSSRRSRAKTDPGKSSSRRRLPKGGIPTGEPGWPAGRTIDGFWFVQDGRDPVWSPPHWMEQLIAQGYDRAADGPLCFVVSEGRTGELGRFPDLRNAFRFALATLEQKGNRPHPESLLIDCRTTSGKFAPVAFGRAVVGMAHGALNAERTWVITAPPD
jgi:hypothetical protein